MCEIPLTPLQTLFWAGHRLHDGVPVYNMAHSFVLPMPIDVLRFQAAFQRVIDQTDALRTIFIERNGIPCQRVLDRFPYGTAVVDFRGEPRPEEAAQSWMRERVTRALDIERCCFDAALLRIAEARHVWFLNQHHIICDATSTTLVFERMARAYGESSDSARDEVWPRFSDYATRRSEAWKELSAERAAYWEARLESEVEAPTFYGRAGGARPARVIRIAHPLGPERSGRLRALAHQEEFFCRSERVSLFNLFGALLSVFLMRISSERRFVIGMPHHGRDTEADWNTAGLYIDVLPLPVSIEPGWRFPDLVAAIALEAAESVRHRPFAGIGSVGARAFDVLFNYQVAQFPSFNGCPAEQEWINPGFGTERLVLQVHDFTGTGDLSLYFDFDVDVFDDHVRANAVRHFRNLLDTVLASPQAPINDLHVLDSGERHHILMAFNQNGRSVPSPDTVTGRFREQCQSTPDACAVRYGDAILTYRGLDAQSNRLARCLLRHGVSNGVPVGLCVDRSPDLIVGMLAILKCGGAYVPLDVTYPKERLALMARDSQSTVLIAQESSLNKVCDLDCRVLCLDRDAAIIAGEDDTPVETELSGETLAYLMYTSGSTGMPKAVSVPHRAIVRLVVGTNYIDIRPSDRVAQASNAAFDAATFEIWGALLNGASIVGIPQDVSLSAEGLAEHIAEGNATVLFLTTALFNQIAQSKPAAFRPLRYLLFGGEACDPGAVRRVLEHGAPEHLLHVYGPTENTTFSTFHDVRDVSVDAPTIPIGKPISYGYAHVLQDDLQPSPIGVPGELYLGGLGLANGYFNQTELTADSFVPSPYRDGERLYRSGDRVRYLPDGAIEFIGRIDGQVKLRGFRIELGEIQAALRSHPGIDDAVVVLREDAPDRKYLVGYIVPANDASPNQETLRSHLRQTLPEYMVPAAFVNLDRIPLTPNGKVDRRALPAPELDRSDHEVIEPRTELEREIADLWKDTLGLPRVGVASRFFDIGGHSLLAVRIMAAVRERYGVDIPLTQFFQNPTVAGMAAVVEGRASGKCGPEDDTPFTLVPIQPKGLLPSLFCVATAGGVLFPYFNLATHLGPGQPLYGLQDPALEGNHPPFDSVEALAAHYVEVMRGRQPVGPYYLCGWSFGGTVAFEMGRQLRAAGEDVALLVIIDAMQAPPDLSVQGGIAKFLRIWLRRARIFILNTYHLKPYILDGLYLVFRRNRGAIGGRVPVREYFRWAFTDVVFKHAGIADVVSKDNLLMMKVPAFRRIFKVLHANGEAWKQYAAPPFDGRITVFRAEVQPPELVGNETLGWGDVALGGVEVHVIPGYHAEILGKGIRHCAAQLRICLERARSRDTNLDDTDLPKAK
ncbi:MAG: amino acid adenylation domain-containing protein [Candidatus Hydrogenedentes bacterium]|nr:amino acid adenylation domain-containing protein [Candidatus Hydrogenedentota bacterium]